MGSRGMAAISLDPRLSLQMGKNLYQNGVVVEKVEGLIRVYNDGHVERPAIVPNVPCTVALELGVTVKDVVIEKYSNLWARFYVPSCPAGKLPLLVYFHGGGFCVGSAAWNCYHGFLADLASKAGCLIMSVNYRLAPENRLPAAYEDGFNAVMWVKNQALNGAGEQKWWLSRCNLSSLFLTGDSAGANIAYNVATRLGSSDTTFLKPLSLKGTILIQPFFGGEARTGSENHSTQPPNSALTLSASDTYWRLSLPLGANRDHPCCNPLANGSTKLRTLQLPPTMVCISDTDILKDRNLQFCTAMANAGKRLETVIYKGVGHAFQVLQNSDLSQPRTKEMISHIRAFITQ
ncbi:hypothetical protein VitviT2T_021915 [Vitis vinifera]|uniref:Alpha/beta hydrolase fold-3 domain-containing protein n=3 Tax=Vitis vinifera TaxID=29760 RepID=A0ABY9D8D8_VITVI|nr:probable carboxylesterase 17 [Vitis vinifera]RVW44850.1 putative carboxylesterase 17 [Vitis vinifera]WKA03830.1 hypothetical protein VitviT2T_021915 [Vitis vinifera]|eukprot:XP_002279965.2 PREDICTED: probable carboxylesterase 17 [Vitis vinifera]